MSATIRFGVFELNLSTMELRKQGMVVRLPNQPFRLLAFLAQRPGELVSREELQQQCCGRTRSLISTMR